MAKDKPKTDSEERKAIRDHVKNTPPTPGPERDKHADKAADMINDYLKRREH